MRWKLHILSDDFFSKVSAIFLFTFLYILNYSDVSSLVVIKKFATLAFCLYSSLLLCLKARKLAQFSQAVLGMTIIGSGILFMTYRRISYISDALLFLTLMQIFETKIILSNKFWRYFLPITLIGIAINLFIYFQGKIFISGLDSNYSAFILFLFFLFLQKLSSFPYLNWLFAFISLATFSRGVFVALSLYFSTFLPISSERIKRWAGVLAPVFLLLIFLVWVLINKNPPALLKQIELMVNNGWNSVGEGMRFFYFINNNSDFVRYEGIINFFKFLKSHPDAIFAGHDLQSYETTWGLIPPHNIFFLQSLQSGLILGNLWLFYFFKQLLDRSVLQFSMLIGLAPYFAFLGIEICAIYTLFLAFVLQLDVRLST